MDEFLETLVNLDYDKSYIDLVIHNTADYHSKQMTEFVEYWGNENLIVSYKSIKVRLNFSLMKFKTTFQI